MFSRVDESEHLAFQAARIILEKLQFLLLSRLMKAVKDGRRRHHSRECPRGSRSRRFFVMLAQLAEFPLPWKLHLRAVIQERLPSALMVFIIQLDDLVNIAVERSRRRWSMQR